MPRPPLKKHRANKHSPRNLQRASPHAGLDNTPRNKLQQRLANKPVGQRAQDSDDSDKLVTRTRNSRSRRNVEQIFASGGVAKGDTPGVFPTKQERMNRLRSDTNEIIRRSRSKSIEDARARLSKSRSISVVTNSVTESASPIPDSQVSHPKSPLVTQSKPQPTPVGETSVLGTLKPRRRQASILHLIGNNDSSIINPEDEEQFLPDDESTPLNKRNDFAGEESSQLSTRALGSVSRKRKLGSDNSETTTNPSRSSLPATQCVIPPNTSTPYVPKSVRQQTALADDDDDIMAPPQSSSPESSPQRSKPQPPTNNKPQKQIQIPTTEQLQALMPSKRRKATRQRHTPTEFDIPDDSNSNGASEAEDESIFQPRKRTTKPGDKAKSSNLKVQAKATRKGRKPDIEGTPAAKAKSTKSTSIPPTVVTPRTPLPLTRNANQENKRMTRAHGRSSTANDKAANIVATPLRGQTAVRNKPSGGSHPQRSLRSGINTGAESDKENLASTRTRSLRKRTLPSEVATDTIHSSIEEVVSAHEDDMEVEVEITEGDSPTTQKGTSPSVAATTFGKGGGPEVKAWKDKWADIDSWSLDYEEVDISTGSSSPMRVSAV